MTVSSKSLVQVYAVSTDDRGPIESTPTAEVPVRRSDSIGAVLDRAIEEFSSNEALSSLLLARYPHVVTRELANDVSLFDPGAVDRAYTITADGTLCCPRDVLKMPWADFERALAADPTSAGANMVAISRDGGAGGIEFLFEGLIGGLAAPAATYLWHRLRIGVSPRVRRIAKKWIDRGLDHPGVIDGWFAKRDRWDVERVSMLLGLTSKESEWVLLNLGYEPLDSGLWVRSHSLQAQQNRVRWDLSIDRNTEIDPA